MTPLDELLEAHPLPDVAGGKDERGTVVIVGGPPECPGAVLLAGTAALRTGSGRVQLVVHPDVAAAVGTALPEALVLAWDLDGEVPPDVARRLEGGGVTVLGTGCDTVPEETARAVADLSAGPTVLDAGALDGAALLVGHPGLVLAPNTAEAERLVADPDPDLGESELAGRLSSRFSVPVAVRGAVTVVADGARSWQFDQAPPGLGTPGSGDVLMGALGALLAAGMAPAGALGWAVHLHAAAGARLAAETPVGYLASEVARELSAARATQGQVGCRPP